MENEKKIEFFRLEDHSSIYPEHLRKSVIERLPMLYSSICGDSLTEQILLKIHGM